MDTVVTDPVSETWCWLEANGDRPAFIRGNQPEPTSVKYLYMFCIYRQQRCAPLAGEVIEAK